MVSSYFGEGELLALATIIDIVQKSFVVKRAPPQYKRIFGELHLEGFDVSFTKNSFQEDDDFSQFIELLKDDLTREQNP